ncbi:MAG: DPP IV N-terminal domain-containing protein [Gemmatimonadota bacterium]
MHRARAAQAVVVCATLLLIAPTLAGAQGTLEEYERANTIGERFHAGLVVDVADNPEWIAETSRFVFRRSVEGGHRFLVMDAETRAQRPAFDHDRLAASLSRETGRSFTATSLPFATVGFANDERALTVTFGGVAWRCTLADYRCAQVEAEAQPTEPQSRPRSFGVVRDMSQPGDSTPRRSPDGRWEVVSHNYNLAVRRAGESENDELVLLSTDGSEGNFYELESVVWAPDSRRLAAFRVRPGHPRQVHYVESSPQDQVQPRYSSELYAKPGDVVDHEQPVIFHLDGPRQVDVPNALFPNPYQLDNLAWWDDGRAVTFEYNQRGHRLYRVIEVDAGTGAARAIIDEKPETFFYYRPSPRGKRFRHDVDDGREIIWMSERDGWNHLYLYDGETGRVKNQITRGEWVVRGVDHVDEANRLVYFRAGGMNPEQDPYFVHYYRINFDGTGLTPLTEANGTHTVSYSPDMEYYVVSWSRVDLPHVTELRLTRDQAVLAELGRGDHAALLDEGWRPPEVFAAKGRDGETDVWGIIIRPSNFDPGKQYPVIEHIYAGPQYSYVPKEFGVLTRGLHQQAEMGFIVAMIDGMGTSNRSKAFHDVAWKDLGDAGFPDRILWHEAVAEQYDWYDISRVGIYGGSAGGQNAVGALLFHPDFYYAAVASNGCHDNRMDKISWNEIWMSWPVGPHYAASSNVDNAHRMEGQLLLIVGEQDTNVDPSSTYQVADALIRADKDFDFLMIPGAGHGVGGSYTLRKRFDFFVRHLHGVEPPRWNGGIQVAAADDGDAAAGEY